MQQAVRELVERARQTTPKAYEPDFVWPYLPVEQCFPDVVSGEPAARRLLLRMARYITVADEFLEHRQPAQALEQWRYIFSHIRGRVPASGLYLRAAQTMSRCYREPGENEMTGQYAARVERALANGHFGLPPAAESKNKKRHTRSCTNRHFP
jgi:hypothetical protein